MVLQRMQIGALRSSHRGRSIGGGIDWEDIGAGVRRAEQTRGGYRRAARSPGRNCRRGGIIVGLKRRKLVGWLLRIHGGGGGGGRVLVALEVLWSPFWGDIEAYRR